MNTLACPAFRGFPSKKSARQQIGLVVPHLLVMKQVRIAVFVGWLMPLFEVFAADRVLPIPPPQAARPPVSQSAGASRVIGTNAGVGTNRLALSPPSAAPAGKPGVLEFDATTKHVDLEPEERKASFVFAVTNISKDEVTISYMNTSCGCTAGKLPSSPWVLKPGEGGHLDVTMDVTGKSGRVTKTATVVASTGSYPLTVSVSIPTPPPSAMNRTRNLQAATADRQAVFRNDCAACHVYPAQGKMGRELYDAACGICHEAEHRASMVPDLRTRLKHTDRNYWTKWIADGRVGSLMPAFSTRNGGILNDQQIATLVDYLEDTYKPNPPPSRTVVEPTGAGVAPSKPPGSPAP